MKTILVAAVALAIGVAVPLVFIQEEPRFQAAVAACMVESGGEDPRAAVWTHFDYPIERLLTLKTAVTGEETGNLYVSGYTLFGIELTKARFGCGDGGITTIKSYGFPVDQPPEYEQIGELSDLVSCEDEFHADPEAEAWKARLNEAGFRVYDVTQLCRLKNGSRTITFKIDEMRLPEAIALFDAEDRLLRSATFECRGLGGEGAHLYVRAVANGIITTACPSVHIDASSEQVYEIDYETFEQEYGFEFQHPSRFDLQLEKHEIPGATTPWLWISLARSDDTIIRLDVNHPGAGVVGMETVLQETVAINGINMFKQAFLGSTEVFNGRKIIMYTFGYKGNEFIWFLNTSTSDSASEAAFQEIVESFRFL